MPRPDLSPLTQSILDEVRPLLRKRYGDRLDRLVLYGSQARGDTHAESDIDVLVVLQGDFDVMAETKALVDIELTCFDRYGVNLHLLPFAAARYADEGHPLMMSVHTEGITL